VRGINVAPAEVEAVLLRHPAVASAYVVGIPLAAGHTGDEALGAVVVLRDDSRGASPGALMAYCRERLARYKVPAQLIVAFSVDLPMTPTGKVLKSELAGWFE
jgi:acyl-CoA synthetase (AMP-forming)/AMP-acid ligase II